MKIWPLNLLLIFSVVTSAASHRTILQSVYPNGDVYFLVGDLEVNIALRHATAFLKNSPSLAKMGFRTIVNLSASSADLAEAVSNRRTKVIVWTSHGMQGGGLIDTNGDCLPENVFFKAGKRRPQLGDVLIVANACFGNDQQDLYFPESVALPRIVWSAYKENDAGVQGGVYAHRLENWLTEIGLVDSINEIFGPTLTDRCQDFLQDTAPESPHPANRS